MAGGRNKPVDIDQARTRNRWSAACAYAQRARATSGISGGGFTTIVHLRGTKPTLLLVGGLPYAAAQALHYSIPPVPRWSPEKRAAY